MGAIKAVFAFGLLILNFIGALFLFTKLAGGIPVYLEILYVLAALLVSLVYLLGTGFDAKWAGPIGLILFAVNMANAVCLYLLIGAFLTFVLLILVNAMGILLSLFSLNDEEDDDFEPIAEPVETYDVEAEKPAKKKSRKRKK
ncbi:hypothetical protein GF358_03230 [Candidatus Woesearchaeota archaeon]|nr:hypothetical protein [Candidatus Woesearchaeota archaeon]